MNAMQCHWHACVYCDIYSGENVFFFLNEAFSIEKLEGFYGKKCKELW